jgi:hypothetical protein
MSVRDLIEFVQEHYSSLQGVPDARQRNPNHAYAPSPDDPNAIQGERPPEPDWLPEEDDPSVVAIGVDEVLSPEGELQPTATEPGRSGDGVTIDTLAFYLPYHFYPSRWGIYLKTSGILLVASLLKGALFSLPDEDLVQLAEKILFEHEFFHFVAETACARAEVVAKTRLYDVYYPHPFGAPHEEALANAHAFRKALLRQPPPVKKAVSTWMKGQGPGYRDFDNWLGRARFEDGCRRSAHYMLQPIGGIVSSSGASPAGRVVAARGGHGPVAPADFLFALPTRKSVPTRLVVDTKVGILKPFPKYAGMRVVVHTNDHPPPHFHIERPPGRPVTRYLWPGLTPYPGDPDLSSSAEKELRTYVERFGAEMGEKVRSVYQSSSRANNTLKLTAAAQ